MSAEQLTYSTQTLHPPSKDSNFQLDVENDWDLLAEAVIGSGPQPNIQLDQLVALLESHGVVVHRVPTPQPPTSSIPSSRFIADPTTNHTNVTTPGWPSKGTNAPLPHTRSLFPRNVALVYGTRVIEAPLSPLSQNGHPPERLDALFKLLENAGAEVVRWPVAYTGGKGTTPEGKLVDVEESSEHDKDEGPSFSPSDILILSPTLLVTRLSSCTNNKGLEYLWSVLSKPAREKHTHQDQGFPTHKQLVHGHSPTGTTTTLLVRITEPESTTPPATINISPTLSPRALGVAPKKSAPAEYIPLCRALVPIDGRIMLYDPALIAKHEARRLKSVLDRVQEGAGGGGGDAGGHFPARDPRRDSVMSYGTFGSLDQSDDEGWQFISVDGLHATSILFVSPELALLSPASSSASGAPSAASVSTMYTPLEEDAVTKVSEVLKTLGVRAVQLPFAQLVEQGGGVRDAMYAADSLVYCSLMKPISRLVLRRESTMNTSDYERGEREQHDGWDLSGGPGEQEGCLNGIFASLAAWICGLFPESLSSEADG